MSTKDAAAAQAVRSVAVYTHRRPEMTNDLVRLLGQLAERLGVELRFDQVETEKHRLSASEFSALKPNSSDGRTADLCLVLGGDGTTLRTLRAYAGTGIPVFSVNCGRVGFLATVDREHAAEGLERALTGRFETLALPSLELAGAERRFAINDVSFQRGENMSVAHLSYALAGQEVARAPCDGLIASTPVGSTAYNLSTGGPVLAWDLQGYVVSMVAPHALNVRSVVAAPDDVLSVVNEGAEPVGIVLDGMSAGTLAPGERSDISFGTGAVGVAQLPGFSFYGRFREKLRLLTA
jgi:NAD+ kinase